jgi:hypothetical protein
MVITRSDDDWFFKVAMSMMTATRTLRAQQMVALKILAVHSDVWFDLLLASDSWTSFSLSRKMWTDVFQEAGLDRINSLAEAY